MRHILRIIVCLLFLGAFGYAQNDQIRMRATVQAVVPLTSFSGHVIPVDLDPRFALTVHVESVIPAVAAFQEGSVVTFAIHSPSLLFAGKSTSGETYNFSLCRTLESGTAKFSGLTLDLPPAPLRRLFGTWETRKSPTTGRANITVNIVQGVDGISGSVRVINPDGTTTQWPIVHTEFKGIAATQSLVFHTDVKGPTLHFQTLDHDITMYWSLTLTSATRGFLRGDERELLIEEKVMKKR